MINTVSLNEDNSYHVKLDDGRVMDVPNSPGNRHYKNIQQWVDDGGVVAAYAPPSMTKKEKIVRDLGEEYGENLGFFMTAILQVMRDIPAAANHLALKPILDKVDEITARY